MTLLETNHIAVQTKGLISRQFTYIDERGHRLGEATNLDGGLKNLIVGSRNFAIKDGRGEIICTLHDTMDFLLDKFEVRFGSEQLALVTHKLSLIGEKFDVTIPDSSLRVQGSFFDREMMIYRPDGSVCARAARTLEWLEITGCRYALEFDPRATAHERRIVLGITIAYELHRIKKKDNDTSALLD